MTLRMRIALQILGITLCLHAEAQADIVAVVSANSSVTRLTTNQVADIFLGRTSRFPDGSPAVPVDLSGGSAERDQFYTKVTGKTPSQIKAYWSKIIFTGRGQPPKTVPNVRDMIKFVAANIDAIGYIDSKMLDDSVRALP